MTSTGTFQGFGDEKKKSSKVLKPPGGGSSDIFGAGPDETSPRRVKNHQQSQLGSTLFGETANSNSSNETPRNKPDGNPVTGTGYAESPQKNGPAAAVQNGISSSSNSSEKSSTDTSPAAKAPARTRVPPGGFSSGLW